METTISKHYRKVPSRMPERRPFRRFKKRPPLTVEQKVLQFILRNSKNGYFTKFSTIPYKFEIPEDRVWNIVGEFLADGVLESIHDERTGEMKLCEVDQTYAVMNQEQKRRHNSFKKKDGKGRGRKPDSHNVMESAGKGSK